MPVAVVTGGCGFLGRYVVDRLLGEGKRVVVFDDASTPGARKPLPAGARLVEFDLTGQDPAWWMNHCCQGEEVDEVWHLASPAAPSLYKTRRLETLKLGGNVLDRILSWATAAKARVLFAGSSEVYGDPETSEQSEAQPSRINPVGDRSCYDAAKVYGEALCAAWTAERGSETRIVRIFNTYGPRQSWRDGRLVPSLVYSALTGEPFRLHGSGLQTRTLAYVDDTIDGMFRVMRAGPDFNAVPVNVGGTTTIDVASLVRLTEQVLDRKITVEWVPRQDADDPMRRRPNLALLRSLGWEEQMSLVAGLKLTARAMEAALGDPS
jgi:dTDP-glucose 4,6-dehydratase